MAWFRPDLFSRVLSYSGTLVDQQDDDAPEEAMYPLGAWEYHSSKALIMNTAKKDLRIFLNVAENDLGASDAESTHHNWVTGQSAHGGGVEGEGLPLSLRVRAWRRPLRQPRALGDVGRCAHLGLARLSAAGMRSALDVAERR